MIANHPKPNRSDFQLTLVGGDDGEQTITVPGERHLWDAALDAGIELPALCHQGWCLTCAGRLIGDGCVDQSDSVSFFPQDREAGFVLLCTGKACSDLKVRTGQARAMRHHRLKLGLPSPYAGL